MKTRTISALALATIVTISAIAAIGAGASVAGSEFSSQDQEHSSESDVYSGTHVAFDASSDALTDYRVGEVTLFDRVAVESKASHQAGVDVGADVTLEAVTNLEGVGLSIAAQTETRATVETDGSASLSAHDTDRGILVVDAGGEGQYVEFALSNERTATERDGRVIVEGESDGGEETRTGAFIVVGDGTVTVNDDGDVTAALAGESKLVFRSYADRERDEGAREQEDLIAEGTAGAEVYAEQRGEEVVTDVATYGGDIVIEATEQSRERLELTVERAEHEGTVVITSVSETVVEAGERADGLSVTVDGEAAVEASSYTELEGAIGSEESRYMVVHHTEAAASADVLVAVNHFSERTVAIESVDGDGDTADDDDSTADDGEAANDTDTDDSSAVDDGSDSETDGVDDGDGDEDDTKAGDDELPGFGVVGALAALLIRTAVRVRG